MKQTREEGIDRKRRKASTVPGTVEKEREETLWDKDLLDNDSPDWHACWFGGKFCVAEQIRAP